MGTATFWVEVVRPVVAPAVLEDEAWGCVVVVPEAPAEGVVEAAGAPKEKPDFAGAGAEAAVVEVVGAAALVAGAAGVVEVAPVAGLAGFPNENPPVAAGLSAGLSADPASAAGLGAPKLKPPAVGAGVAAIGGERRQVSLL